MSSFRRPWYPWYPKDFNTDEKVKGLSDDAELLYRRVLDVMWQANDQHLLSNCYNLLQQLARGWQKKRFEAAWNELILPGFELIKTTKDGKWVYSERLCREAEKIQAINNKRKVSGQKGGEAKAKQTLSKCLANAKQTLSHTYTDTDIYKERIYKKEKKINPPSLQDVISYFQQNNFSADLAKRAFDHYDLADWHDTNGKPVRNWKQKMSTVWFKDENRNGGKPEIQPKTYAQAQDAERRAIARMVLDAEQSESQHNAGEIEHKRDE